MLIAHTTLRNIAAFGDEPQSVELRPLNILIGPNGSGKTSFIRAVHAVKENAVYWPALVPNSPHDPETTIAEHSLIPASGPNVRLRLQGHHDIAHAPVGFFMSEDMAFHKYQAVDVTIDFTKRAQAITGLHSQQLRHRVINQLAEHHGAFDDSQRHRFNERLNDLCPYAADIAFDTSNHRFPSATITTASGRRLPDTVLSDTAIRYLAIHAALINPTTASAILIDEAGANLHHDLAHSMADAITAATSQTQVFVATHSHILLDLLYTPDARLIAFHTDAHGVNRFRTVPTAEITQLLADHPGVSLSNLWIAGYIGANRW